jgi:hypothetical protein
MIFKYHNTDYRKLPNEDDVRAVVRAGSPPPGQYFMPHCMDHKELQKPEVVQKFVEGPIALVTVRPNGAPTIGPALTQWFVLNLAVAAIVGYLAARALPPEASFMRICRLVGAVTFLAYGIGAIQQSIWMGKPWPSTLKDLLDAAIYGLVSALAFGWLWPRG